MTQAQKSNQRLIMKEAHKLTRETILEGQDYIVNFSIAMKIVSNRMKSVKKTSAPKSYLGGVVTPAQLATIAKMRAVLGSKWDGTSVNGLTRVQASIEIERNMTLYLEEKELNFCDVATWQKIITMYAKAGKALTAVRRSVSKAKAEDFLKRNKN